MNILIPHSWLLEHLDTEATPQEIQKHLSLSGPSIERIHETEGEPVYDIEITTNRVDSMSVRGVAREAAVILTQTGFPSKLKPSLTIPSYMLRPTKLGKSNPRLPTIINDSSVCSRIMCTIISDVKRVPSPEWIQMRLRQVGLHVHDAVIDITNYVTHDLGHPCHAFDYDKVMNLGGMIRVTVATKGKHFTTLDGASYETVGGEVVFENADGEIIDLPGIKGTVNTSIDANTKNVLFWIESIEPTKIRFASMSHAIRTVAAQLNEKNVDPHLALPVFAKGIELYASLTAGNVEESSFTDIYPRPQEMKDVTVPLSRITQYLGIELPPERVKEILEDLECVVKTVGKKLVVTPPSFRPDITIPEDIVEEIARIYGYHNLPSVLMSGAIPTVRPEDTNFSLEHESRILLSTLGGYDVYTYSMISEEQATRESSYISPETDLIKTHVKLKNPLTDDMVYMRRTLWTSHESILKTQSPSFVFEIANTYIPVDPTQGTTLPHEEMHLTLTTTGEERRLKGALDALLRSLYLPPASYEVNSEHDTRIHASNMVIGHMLSLISEGKAMYVIDLDWKMLVMTAKKYPVVKAIPKVSPIIEDMTFTLKNSTYVQDILTTIQSIDSLIEKVIYKEMYKRNATFTIYYQPSEEMSTANIAPLRKKIVEKLESSYESQFVGSLQDHAPKKNTVS